MSNPRQPRRTNFRLPDAQIAHLKSTVLAVGKLNFGSIDAKHELILDSQEERSRFKEAFASPISFDVNNYISGERFIISGLKGTGKTALLNYLRIVLSESPDTHTAVRLFSRVLQDDPGPPLESSDAISDLSNLQDSSDYEHQWKWFIHTLILDACLNAGSAFEQNDAFRSYADLIKSVQESRAVQRGSTFPRLQGGSITFGVTIPPVLAKLEADFESSQSTPNSVSFSALIAKLDNLYEHLTEKSGHSLYIFLDEIELSFGSTTQYERQVRLIRDLVRAIYDFNIWSKQLNLHVRLIAAVRSEVLNSASVAGKEINKIIEDFGFHVVWHQSGGDVETHPLLRMLARRIRIAVNELGDPLTDDRDVWRRYFPKTIQTQPVPKFLLQLTWMRPRDLIRLFKLAQSSFPDRYEFGHDAFDATFGEYGHRSWIELVEELNTTYSKSDIQAVEHLLTGFRDRFMFNHFSDRCNNLSNIYESVDSLLKKKKPADILDDLYRIGGNR